MKVIEFDEKCKSCGGTGLYVGMAERGGAAVVCHTCKGTGCHHFRYEYEDFTERSKRPDVERVHIVNLGLCIGGIPYDAWLRGENFIKGTENRKYTCPAWWYQSADYNKKPNWNECRFGSFLSCKYFTDKESCWKRWDSENG